MHTPTRKFSPVNLNSISKLDAEVRKWKRALTTYGHHTSDCWHYGGHDCNCGLEELREEAKK